MSAPPLLLPAPRSLVFGEGGYDTRDNRTVSFAHDPNVVPQGYRLSITPDGIRCAYSDAAGAHYARLTLAQLSDQYGDIIPAMTIDDAPDFERRGVMLDCSRDRVPQLRTLYALIDLLASWKINELQLYTEHTFAYAGHEEVWAQASPFTPSDIEALVRYCQARFIDLVPCQSSLGHMERWLKHPRYAPLAEAPDGFTLPWESWGELQIVRPPSTLDPSDPGSLKLVASLFDQLLPLFPSEYVNICDDEPFELGAGKNRHAVETRGGRVYLDYLLRLHDHIAARGKRVQFWADIITQHPELIPELPPRIVPLIWGYEDWQPAEQHVEMVASTGLAFYVCPGTSSWNSLSGRTTNAIGNLRRAAELGLKYHALGYLNTDWGDHGHMQALPVSYMGFAYGAALAWCHRANRDADIAALLDRYAFADHAGVMGQVALDLGDVHTLLPIPQVNSSWLFHAIFWSERELRLRCQQVVAEAGAEPLTAEPVRAALARIESILARIDGADMARDDALIKAEFRHAGRLLMHGAKRMLRMLGAPDAPDNATMRAELEPLVAEQRRLWLARSRPGGLEDSLARFAVPLGEYQ
jgi:hypothetical protein